MKRIFILSSWLLFWGCNKDRSVDKLMQVTNDAYKLNNQKKYKEAILSCDTLIEICKDIDYKTNLRAAYDLRAQSKAEINDSKGALEDYNSSLLLDSTNAYTYYHIGELYRNNYRNFNIAIRNYSRAIELDSTQWRFYFFKAYAYHMLSKNDLALYYTNKSIDLNSEFSINFIQRGYIKKELNDQEGACSDWEKALELGSSTAKNIIDQYCQ